MSAKPSVGRLPQGMQLSFEENMGDFGFNGLLCNVVGQNAFYWRVHRIGLTQKNNSALNAFA
jgi:hypothetical protein